MHDSVNKREVKIEERNLIVDVNTRSDRSIVVLRTIAASLVLPR